MFVHNEMLYPCPCVVFDCVFACVIVCECVRVCALYAKRAQQQQQIRVVPL